MKTRAAVAMEAGKPLEIMEVDLDGPRAGEVLVDQTLPWCPRLWDEDADQVALSPLQHLALSALHQEL